MPSYVMTIDLNRCHGIRACMEACKVENNTAEGVFWMHVFRYEQDSYPAVKVKFLPRPCQHCDNPPCVKVCPVGARYKRDDGFVLTDFKRCIGCRYCEVSCPYGVNYFNWRKPKDNYYLDWDDKDIESVTKGNVPPYKNPALDKRYGPGERLIAGGGHFKGTMEKCTFCVHRLDTGQRPACVANCPTDALHFGDLDDPDSDVSKILSRTPHWHLLEDRGTKPRVFYLGGDPPESKARPIEKVKARI